MRDTFKRVAVGTVIFAGLIAIDQLSDNPVLNATGIDFAYTTQDLQLVTVSASLDYKGDRACIEALLPVSTQAVTANMMQEQIDSFSREETQAFYQKIVDRLKKDLAEYSICNGTTVSGDAKLNLRVTDAWRLPIFNP